MANVQKQFEQYDDKIRLTRYDENATLVKRRDAVLDKLRDRFRAMRKEGKDIPTFRWFNQGSYEMGTGIDPENGDYDIDVGLDFNATKSEYENPVTLKELVYDALKDHTPLGTVVRRSCVTVKYQIDGELAYHVDLAIYTCDNTEADPRTLYLAKGKLNSAPEHREWGLSDPKGLTAWVAERFEGDEETQFLRVVRALKGWKSCMFDHNGNSAPPGIGLTIAAGRLFRPEVAIDPVTMKTTCDDRKAMRRLVDAMVRDFSLVVSQETPGTQVERLLVALPVVPNKDVFAKMTDTQSRNFKAKLVGLRDLLDAVEREEDPVEACTKMQKQFGSRFPVPPKEETAKSGNRAITSSGVSA
ncbi:nucleotidyltransferase domain-containing protein [Sorangium sp. So ce381]|uniref:nucleotidyltransferase domain-containing protein n=1 Tax=Sorangium sp. So ce381 TaxID=3133307 RepID=UPI003F5AEA9D